MRSDKQQAIQLRKEGKSYLQISRTLGVGKSTLSYWLKEVILSAQAQKKISDRAYSLSVEALIKRNKAQTTIARQRADSIRQEAKKEVPRLMSNKLFIAGVSLYWAEGYKKGAYGSKWKSVDFANSDPNMVMVMMRFFRECCGVHDQRIKIQLIAHRNIDIDKAVHFWSHVTKIPASQFIKTCTSVNKTSKNIRDNHSLTQGTVHIRINDVKLFFKVIGWIEGMQVLFSMRVTSSVG